MCTRLALAVNLFQFNTRFHYDTWLFVEPNENKAQNREWTRIGATQHKTINNRQYYNI